jgi:arylsulfatase A-like enzyme
MAVWCGVSSCGRASPPNVVLVTIDTLRADHLSFYGYDRVTTPYVAEWLDEATLFENCYSPLPLTDPSMSSMMTGLYPIRHGVRHTGRKLRPSFITLAQVLRSHGYATAAFASRNGLVSPGQLDRGFDLADFVGGDGAKLALQGRRATAERWQRRADSVTAAALRWLESPPERPFFMWLHYFDPHAFYDPPEAFRNRFVGDAEPSPATNLRAWWGTVSDLGETIAHYDAEILTSDHYLAQVVAKLQGHNLWDSTLFVLTSDHGESLGEHGHMDHGEWLYHEQIHVPLLMRYPGAVPGGLRVSQLVRLIDLAPTILDLLGLSGDDVDDFVHGMDGESFAALMDGGEIEPRRIFVESENCPKRFRNIIAPDMICDPPGVDGKLRGVYDGRWKLIITPGRKGRSIELYDLQVDREETTNLSEAEPERVQELEAALDEFWGIESPRSGVDTELIERLRALGYAD